MEIKSCKSTEQFFSIYEDSVKELLNSNQFRLRSTKIGVSVFATRLIPKGTTYEVAVIYNVDPSLRTDLLKSYLWTTSEGRYLVPGLGMIANGGCKEFINDRRNFLAFKKLIPNVILNVTRNAAIFTITQDIQVGDQVVIDYSKDYFYLNYSRNIPVIYDIPQDQLENLKRIYSDTRKSEYYKRLKAIRSNLLLADSSELMEDYNKVVKFFSIDKDIDRNRFSVLAYAKKQFAIDFDEVNDVIKASNSEYKVEYLYSPAIDDPLEGVREFYIIELLSKARMSSRFNPEDTYLIKQVLEGPRSKLNTKIQLSRSTLLVKDVRDD
jgi:hypothetical protein